MTTTSKIDQLRVQYAQMNRQMASVVGLAKKVPTCGGFIKPINMWTPDEQKQVNDVLAELVDIYGAGWEDRERIRKQLQDEGEDI